MFERTAGSPALVGLWLALAGCAASAPERDAPGSAHAGGVLESVNPVRPDDRAAAARRAWLERQAAARRSAPAPGASAAPAAVASPEIEQGSTGKLLIFSSVTGHVPIDDVRRVTSGSPEDREAARVAELERALEAERALEERPRGAAEVSPAASGGASNPAASPAASPLSAPVAPALPDLDPALLRVEQATLPAGSWGNAQDLPVVRRSLDADANGRPEQVRYFEVTTDELLRSEEDRDLDGNTDTWCRFERGALTERVLDTNADARPDSWEIYVNGRMTAREYDADHDGVRDAVYRYKNDSLAEVRRDVDGDGKIDRVESFEVRRRVQVIEDANHDERMDTWTTYRVIEGKEVAVRIERDTRGRGKPDVFETYRAAPGKPVLEKREEDLDGDGAIDVTQRFEPDGRPSPGQAAPL